MQPSSSFSSSAGQSVKSKVLQPVLPLLIKHLMANKLSFLVTLHSSSSPSMRSLTWRDGVVVVDAKELDELFSDVTSSSTR